MVEVTPGPTAEGLSDSPGSEFEIIGEMGQDQGNRSLGAGFADIAATH